MSHLRPQAIHDLFVVCETTSGVEVFPADAVGLNESYADYTTGTIASVELVTGWFARLSAPGYMDCTEWSGPFPSEEAALAHLEEMYGED